MSIDQPDHGIPLPLLSDEAAVEILYFLEATFQIFETHYANQIARFYEGITHRNMIASHPQKIHDNDPPF
jgi:hypothetical protein